MQHKTTIRRVLDTTRPNTSKPIFAVSGDYSVRKIRAIIAADGEPIMVPATAAVVISAERPDGLSDSFAGQANGDGSVTVPVVQWMISVEGEVDCSVSVTTAAGKISTTLFYINVQKSPNIGEVSEDDPEYDLIALVLASENERQENEKKRVEAEEKRAEEFDGWKIGVYTESDPTVPAWAKQPTKPSYTASEVGAAPAGFGLGATAGKDVSSTDFNTITANGWYCFNYGGANMPDPTLGYSYMFVCGREGSVTQYIFQSNTAALAGCIHKRTMFNGTWGEWEWVNPPMFLGVEYRTTERWQGKPVYIKAVDLGLLASNTTKYIDIGVSAVNAIEARFFVAGNPMKTFPIVNYENGDVQAIAWLQSAQAIVRTFTTFTDYSLKLVVKYTKD